MCVLLLCATVACKKSDGLDDEDVREPQLHFVGFKYKDSFKVKDRNAVLVVGDSLVELSPDKVSEATTLDVSGNTVYVGGYQQVDANRRNLAYWENGTVHFLGTAANGNEATAIHAADGKLYVAGTIYQANLPYQRLWVDGEQKVNSGALAFSGIRDIAVWKGKYYLAGQFAQAASLWEDQTMYTIHNGPSEASYILTRSEDEILSLGYGNVDRNSDKVVVWNWRDVIFSHPLGIRVRNILGCIDGSDYYYVINGVNADGWSVVRVYKNEQMLYDITDGKELDAEAIQFHQGKLYILGNFTTNTRSTPVLWIDGVPQDIFNEKDGIYLNDMLIK